MDAQLKMSEASSNRPPSSGRSKSRRSQLQDAKCHSTSALLELDLSPPSSNRKSKSSKSKSELKSRRRKSLDNSSSAGSRSSSSSRRIKEESPPPKPHQQQQQTNELLKKQQRRRGSLDFRHRDSSSATIQINNQSSDGVVLDDKSETRAPPTTPPITTLLHNSTHSTSRFSTSSISRRHSVDSSTPPRMTRTNNNSSKSIYNDEKVASVVVHTCDEKGRCIFHPHIQLRKKSIMGIAGGWKDLYTKCPDCEKQELLELLLKEKEEIGRLERLLGRLDAHDVEYLNDDGVDDDGNYLKSCDGQKKSEKEVGNGDGGGEKKVVEITFAEGCRLPMTMERRRSSLF